MMKWIFLLLALIPGLAYGQSYNAQSYTSGSFYKGCGGSGGVCSADLLVLPVQLNGTLTYCNDCFQNITCDPGGHGAPAMMINGHWNCGWGTMGTACESGSFDNIGTINALMGPGNISITGNTSTSQISGININGLLNVVAYGADPTGVKDSTSAIQAAINASAPGGHCSGQSIYLPQGQYKVSQLNLTGLCMDGTGSLRLYGESGIEGQATKINCVETADDTGVCIDMSGSDFITLDHLTINANTATSPKFAVAWARTTTDPGWSNGGGLDMVTIGAKYYAYYTFGGEVIHNSNVTISTVLGPPVTLSANNTAGFSSPFQTTLPATGVSMTANVFLNSDLHAGGPSFTGVGTAQPDIYIDDPGTTVSNFSIQGGWSTVDSNGGVFIKEAGGLFRNWSVRDVRVEAEGNHTTAQFAVIGGYADGFTIDTSNIVTLGNGVPPATGPVVPTVPSLQFGNTIYSGFIELRPGDGQPQYPNPMMTCAANAVGVIVLPTDASGGGPVGINCPGVTTPYYGVPTVVTATSNANIASGQYMPLIGAAMGTEAGVHQIIPFKTSAVIGKMQCWTQAAPGAGNSWIFTLSQNGGAQTFMQCTISGTNQTCNVPTTMFGLTSGDLYATGITSTGTPVPAPATCGYQLRTSEG